MPKYNTMIDVACSIEHDCEDPYDIPVADMIAAMTLRLQELRKTPENEAFEAFGICDTYEIPVGLEKDAGL